MSLRRWVSLWLGFAAVHATLIAENLVAPNAPLGDVEHVYPIWWSQGLSGGGWVGLTAPGVYPFLALVPIAFAGVGVAAWFTLVTVLDGVAVAVLAHRHPIAAWSWLGFQFALGPIALGRVDAITVALAILAVALIERSPRAAGVLVAIATWVKVWPIVLGVAALTSPRFGVIARWSIGAAVALLAVGVITGDSGSVVSFLGSQSSRGVQVESVAATPWLWNAWMGGSSAVTFNEYLNTFEVSGNGTDLVALLLTAIQGLLLAALTVLIVIVGRRGSSSLSWMSRFAASTLALVALLITLNKVGSPQFVSWLAVPLVALVVAGAGRRSGGTIALT
ncbi:MAG: hypothetical protein RLZZ319_299, partial [Actinomycetota bacterium]